MAAHVQAGHDPDVASAVLAAWRQGHDTRTIVETLFACEGRKKAWFEDRVCRIIAAEQDRRYAKRIVARRA